MVQTNTTLLLVCASAGEAGPLLAREKAWIRPNGSLYRGQGRLEGAVLLVTGIGMVNMAWQLGRHLEALKPDLCVNFGIAGAFDESGLAPGDLCEVVTDCFADLGAQSPDGFLDLAALGFDNFRLDGIPVHNKLTNPDPSSRGIRKVRGITVNTVSGDVQGIMRRRQLWNPQVETMESAAFFQCCMLAGAKFQAFRAISNVVGPRNRADWKVGEAVHAITAFIIDQFLISPS